MLDFGYFETKPSKYSPLSILISIYLFRDGNKFQPVLTVLLEVLMYFESYVCQSMPVRKYELIGTE